MENGTTAIYIHSGSNAIYGKVTEKSTVTMYMYGAGKIAVKIRG